MTPIEKLENWFVRPIERLKSQRTSDSDGAFLALCGALALYERFIVASLKHSGTRADPEAVKNFGATDLGITPDEFNKFWGMFRHGANHAFQPKRFTSSGMRYGWEISGSHGPIPVFEQREVDLVVITLNPWDFATYVAEKFQSAPHLFDILDQNKLANVNIEAPESLPVSRDEAEKVTEPFLSTDHPTSGVFPEG